MKIVFLDAATMGSTPLTEIEKLGELTRYESSTAEEARERVKDADVAILNKIIVNEDFLDAAMECGHRSFTVMGGAFGEDRLETEVLAHEATFGVGYGFAVYHPVREEEDG